MQHLCDSCVVHMLTRENSLYPWSITRTLSKAPGFKWMHRVSNKSQVCWTRNQKVRESGCLKKQVYKKWWTVTNMYDITITCLKELGEDFSVKLKTRLTEYRSVLEEVVRRLSFQHATSGFLHDLWYNIIPKLSSWVVACINWITWTNEEERATVCYKQLLSATNKRWNKMIIDRKP